MLRCIRHTGVLFGISLAVSGAAIAVASPDVFSIPFILLVTVPYALQGSFKAVLREYPDLGVPEG